MKFLRVIQFAVALTLLGGVARADLIIDIRDASITSGGTGFVDVVISSTSTNDLGKFSAKFNIVQTSGSGVLEFQSNFNSTDANRQKDTERRTDNYVFGGTLGNGFVSNRVGDAQNLLQGDRSTANVTLGAGESLLARLELAHVLPAGASGVGTYEVSLVNDAFTRFQLLDNTVVGVDEQSFATSESNAVDGTNFTNFGTITVNAVPEPSAGLLLALSGLGAVFIRRSRSCE